MRRRSRLLLSICPRQHHCMLAISINPSQVISEFQIPNLQHNAVLVLQAMPRQSLLVVAKICWHCFLHRIHRKSTCFRTPGRCCRPSSWFARLLSSSWTMSLLPYCTRQIISAVRGLGGGVWSAFSWGWVWWAWGDAHLRFIAVLWGPPPGRKLLL